MTHKILIILNCICLWAVVLLTLAFFKFTSNYDPKLEYATQIFESLSARDYLKQHLESVDNFGPLRTWEKSPHGEGRTAPFENKPIPKSEFYVYVQRRWIWLCEFESCGVIEGKVISCMGWWLSWDSSIEISDMVWLDPSDVAKWKASIVVLADSDSKIIGIYLNHTESDILKILWSIPEYQTSLLSCIKKQAIFDWLYVY